MHPRTQTALDGVARTFGEKRVIIEEMPDGVVWLTVKDMKIGRGWNCDVTDLSVKLVTSFPDTQPYPWYLPGEVTRTDGHVIPQLQAPALLEGRSRRQLSLGGPWTPSHSLADRILGVERWLRSQRPPGPATA